MYFTILHFTRQILQRRLTQEINRHPYYGSAGTEAMLVTGRQGFDFKRFPVAIIHTPSGTDEALDLGQFLMEDKGHVQIAQDSWFFTEVYTTLDPTYAVTFTDETYTLTVISGGTKLEVLTASTGQIDTHDITPDDINTEILSGISIRFASYNNIIEGSVAIIKTYEDERVVGDIFSAHWPLSCAIDCYHRRSVQAEEITDLVISILSLERDNFLRQDGIQARHITINGEADNPTDFGDEIYGHSLTIEFDLEWKAKVAQDIFTGWNLVVPVSPDDPAFPDYVLSGGSAR